MHGSFSRADTNNFMAAIGPDFKTGYVDPAPASNADVGKTIAQILKLDIKPKGNLIGRVLDEAMPNGTEPAVVRDTLVSPSGFDDAATILNWQAVGDTRYFDSAADVRIDGKNRQASQRN